MGRKNRTMRKCGTFLLFFVLILSGCQQEHGDLQHSSTVSGQPVSRQSVEETEEKEQCTSVPTKDGKQGKDDFSTIKGKITEVFYGNDGDLLIQTEKEIYLYHVEDKTVKAEMKVPNLRELSVKRLDGGYVMVGKSSQSEKKGGGMAVSSDSSDGQWKVWILDASLKQREKINLSKLIGDKKDVFHGECIAVSHAGRKIAVATEEEILLCDVQSKKRHQILDFTKKQVVNHLVLDGANQIAFTKDDRKIALFSSVLSESAADGEESISAWGTVSLDGKELEMSADANYYGEEMCVYDDCLILPESFEHNSSRLLKIDIDSGKKSFIPFSHKREGKDGVYPSADGKYFATACLSGKSVTVRVYDMEKGKVLLEKTLKDKNEDYFYRIPRIYLVDGAKTCVVVLGAGMEEVETKVEQFSWR